LAILITVTVGNDDPMIAEIQAVMDYYSNVTGYGFSLGYVDDEGRDFGLGSGARTFNKEMPY